MRRRQLRTILSLGHPLLHILTTIINLKRRTSSCISYHSFTANLPSFRLRNRHPLHSLHFQHHLNISPTHPTPSSPSLPQHPTPYSIERPSPPLLPPPHWRRADFHRDVKVTKPQKKRKGSIDEEVRENWVSEEKIWWVSWRECGGRAESGCESARKVTESVRV